MLSVFKLTYQTNRSNQHHQHAADLIVSLSPVRVLLPCALFSFVQPSFELKLHAFELHQHQWASRGKEKALCFKQPVKRNKARQKRILLQTPATLKQSDGGKTGL